MFCWLIYKSPFFKADGLLKKHLIIAFTIKVIAGVFLGLLYIYYYADRSTADTLKFFDDSKLLFDLLKEHPKKFLKIFTGIGSNDSELNTVYLQMNTWMYEEFMSSNRTMVRLDAFFRFFIPGNYYFVHVVFINFLSFSGLVYLYRIFAGLLKLNRLILYFCVFFTPSLLFWGSGLLKEGVLLFALGGFLFHFVKLLKTRSTYTNLIFFLLFGLLLTLIKIYMLLVLLPALIGYYLSLIYSKRIVVNYVVSTLFIFTLLFNIKSFIPRFDLSHYLYVKQRDFLDIVRTENPTSAIEIPVIEPNVWSIIANAPRGFLTTLTRPFLFESISPLILMASLENFFILLLLLFCIFNFKKPDKSEYNFVSFCIGMVVILFVLIGLVTPVEGAIVRYKSIALPFLFAALFSLTGFDWLKKISGSTQKNIS